MELIVIGKGNHVIKNIIPAVNRCTGVEIIGYINRENQFLDERTGYLEQVNDIFFKKYESAYYYIATPIASHYRIAKTLLENNCNVICEKLLTDEKNKTVELFSMSKKLLEVCMYKYHLAFDYAVKLFLESYDEIKEVVADFCIPHLESDDFRYVKDLGGGAINDLGFYPISFLECLPKGKTFHKSSITIDEKLGVDLSGSLVLKGGGVTYEAKWALGDVYSNSIKFVTNSKTIVLERFFSKPHDFEVPVKTFDSEGELMSVRSLQRDDQFKNLFESIRDGNTAKHSSDNSIKVSSLIQKVKEGL